MDDLAADKSDEIRLRVLGQPMIVQADGTSLELTKLDGGLLVALALAGPRGRSKTWLRDNLWTTGADFNTVATAVTRLRRKAPIPVPKSGANYVLDLPESSIDAQVFMNAIRSLPTPAPIDQLDELLGMWTDNPWDGSSRLPDRCWRQVKEARNVLVAAVHGLTDAERADLSHWNQFCDIFHAEAPQWRGEPERTVARPKRVLVVDDLIATPLAEALDGEFECHPVASLKDWNRMVKEGHLLDYDCALVDLHLTSGMIDKGGELILQDLRRLRPEMPTALMSAELPYEDLEGLKQKLGVRNVIPKHNNENGPMVPLRDLVRKLIAEG
jgi:DNA-binding response OmpR family regulator